MININENNKFGREIQSLICGAFVSWTCLREDYYILSLLYLRTITRNCILILCNKFVKF